MAVFHPSRYWWRPCAFSASFISGWVMATADPNGAYGGWMMGCQRLDEWWMKIRLMLLWLLWRESSHIISKLQTNISLKILGSSVRRESKLHWRVGLAIYPTEVGIYGWQRSYSLLTLGSERLWSHARWYPVAIICFITPLKCSYIIIPAGNWFGSLPSLSNLLTGLLNSHEPIVLVDITQELCPCRDFNQLPCGSYFFLLRKLSHCICVLNNPGHCSKSPRFVGYPMCQQLVPISSGDHPDNEEDRSHAQFVLAKVGGLLKQKLDT